MTALHSGEGDPVKDSTLLEVERDYILRIFRESGGVVTRMAIRLRMPRTTLSTYYEDARNILRRSFKKRQRRPFADGAGPVVLRA